MDNYLYKYDGVGKIEGIEFVPNNKSFVIIYKQQTPIHYNIKSGHKIAIFKQLVIIKVKHFIILFLLRVDFLV